MISSKCFNYVTIKKKLLGGRPEYSPYKETAAVLFTKTRGFFSLGVAGHEMYFEVMEFLCFPFPSNVILIVCLLCLLYYLLTFTPGCYVKPVLKEPALISYDIKLQ